MNAPVATLGGILLTDEDSVGLEQTAGVTPFVRTFTLHKSSESKVRAMLGSPVTLEVRSKTAPTLTWEQVYPLRLAPSRVPHHVSVVVADLRWLWPRQIVNRTYNLPRKTGVRRIVAGQVVELAVFKDEYRYVPATLKDGKRKWTPREIVEDVLGRMAQVFGFSWEIESWPAGSGLAVEGLEVHESCDHALAAVLALAPGAEVRVTKTGRVVVFDATDMAATDGMMRSAGPPTEAGGIDRTVTLEKIRPTSITVWFDREVELRFDSAEESDDADSTVQQGDFLERQMLMENVLPLPDPNTLIDGEQYGQGTWVTVKQALAAWNLDLASLGKSPAPPALTLTNVRRYWFVLEALYTALGNLTQSAAQANWSARIAALRAHFRQTYRIPYAWMQRIRAIKPYRLGILDPVTGARATAQAWSQYTKEPTAKAYAQAALKRDPNLQFFWLSVDDYPGFDNNLWEKTASPAAVTVLDQDVGILHIGYRTDPFAMASGIHPSLMRENGTGEIQAPTRDLRNALRGVVSTDGTVKGAIPIGLADDFRVAILVTAIPLAPNDETRMFSLPVDPSSVSDEVRGRVQIKDGEGPDWNLICPPGLLTAWYAHRLTVDARQSAPKLFGFDGPAALANGAQDAPGYEIINLSDTNDYLRGVAFAMAVAQWAAFVDAREGQRSVHLNPRLELAGSIDSIRHRLDPDGRLLTDVNMPSNRRPIDPMALIPRSIRPWILGVPDVHA